MNPFWTILLTLGVLLVSPVARAESTTQPARATRVLILPLESINPAPEHLWIGPAVQQSLLAEFASIKSLQAVTLDTPGPAKPNGFIGVAKAISLGQDHDASFVLFGSYQTLDGNVRITAQVLNVDAEEIVGGLKVTGPTNDLFTLQDQLAEQARRVMLRRNGIRGGNASARSAANDEPRIELEVTGPLTVHNDNPYYDRARDRVPDWMRHDGPYMAGNYRDGRHDYFYGAPLDARAYGYNPFLFQYHNPYYHFGAYRFFPPYVPAPPTYIFP